MEKNMITKEFKESITEINKILSYLPNEYVEKIPIKLRKFFSDVESKEYIPNIDPHKTLDDQVLLPKTKVLLAVVYRNYWCSEEEKAEFDKILTENDRKHEEELRKKYNPDNIFKEKNENKKNGEIKEIEEANLIVYDNKLWYQKAFNFISNLFNKIFKK
jgi:hypothetical protein